MNFHLSFFFVFSQTLFYPWFFDYFHSTFHCMMKMSNFSSIHSTKIKEIHAKIMHAYKFLLFFFASPSSHGSQSIFSLSLFCTFYSTVKSHEKFLKVLVLLPFKYLEFICSMAIPMITFSSAKSWVFSSFLLLYPSTDIFLATCL